jgi:tyrosyl-tRNA synthetase
MKDKEKFVLATKLLVDSQGEKLGKTTGNALFLNSKPEEFFGGIMSFPDTAITPGFELLTEVNLESIDQKIKKSPMNEKKKLAFEVTKILWGTADAKKAQVHFEKTFQERSSEYEQEIKFGNNLAGTVADTIDSSLSEAKRLISQGSVDINEKVITDPTHTPEKGDKIKIGKKKFVKIN